MRSKHKHIINMFDCHRGCSRSLRIAAIKVRKFNGSNCEQTATGRVSKLHSDRLSPKAEYPQQVFAYNGNHHKQEASVAELVRLVGRLTGATETVLLAITVRIFRESKCGANRSIGITESDTI